MRCREIQLDRPISPFLKHEGRNASLAQGSGITDEIVRVLLHSVADEDQRLHLEELPFAPGMGKHLADLGVTVRQSMRSISPVGVRAV